MADLEHPAIEKINQYGYLSAQDRTPTVDVCACCDTPLKQNVSVVEFQDHLFCDTDCLTEAISENPERFGAEITELS